MRVSVSFWLIFGILGPLVAHSGVGDPFERRFSPSELDVYPQNFDIVQSPDGLIYVANSEGVLEFDGARWRLIKLPEGEFARSLEIDGNGRVFVGSYNHFGYLERNQSGATAFVELANEFVTEEQQSRLADVWDVVATDLGVFFATRNMLFLWNDGPVDTWTSEPGFGTFAHAGGRYLVRERELGIKELLDGDFQLIPGSEPFGDTRINLMTTLPDGRVLIVPEDQLYTLSGDRIEPLPMEYAGLPRPAQIYRIQVLVDGSLAMGTTTGEIHIVSADGLTGRRYGISDYIISGLMVGQDGALWAATDEDIVRLAIPSPWSFFGSQHGFSGFVTDSEMFMGARLISTNAGVYRLNEQGSADGGPSFERLDWGDNEFWSLVSKPDGLLVAESYTIRLATEDGIEPITETIYPRRLVPSPFNEDVVFIAGETGLATLVRDQGEWTVAGDFTDLDIRAYYVVEESPRELWIGTYGNALYRVRLSTDYSRIVSNEAFDETAGLKLDVTRGVVVSSVVGSSVFATDEGLFEFNGEVFVPNNHPALDAYLDQGFEPGVEFHTREPGEVWANSGRELFRGLYRDGRWVWNKVHLGPFDNTAVEALVFDEKTTWIGAAAALIRFDSSIPALTGATAKILLRGMQVRQADQSVEQIDVSKSVSPTLAWGRQTVSFSYTVPSYGETGATEYRTQLQGFDTEWSGWNRDADASYSGLAPGWYLFRVQARTSAGGSAGEDSVTFQIAPPWFRTPLAYIMFVLSAFLFFVVLTAGLVRWRSRHLRLLSRRLERELAAREDTLRERTGELAMAKQQLKELPEQDGLTGVANRRRLDAFLTESWTRCREQHTPLTVLVIDADRLQSCNDQHGHLAGDEVLKALAATMQSRIRDSGQLLARCGGEEFALVLPGFEMDAAVSFGETLRVAVVEASDETRGITVSVGIGQVLPQEEETLATLWQRAEQALALAKSRGRNCVAA